jgi:hypothetical protein
VATGLSCRASAYYLLPPLHSFGVSSGVEQWQLFCLGFVGVAVSSVNEALHRSRARAQFATQRLEVKRVWLAEAQGGLRTSLAEFRTLAESLPQIVWVTRPDGAAELLRGVTTRN